MRLSKAADRRNPLRTLKVWLRELSDDVDGAQTLQFELINGLLRLRLQAHKDGWMNWSENYGERIDLLMTFLPSGSREKGIRRDLTAVREAGETGSDEGRFAYDELDRLVIDMMDWCLRYRDWIRLPSGYTFWSDVPPELLRPKRRPWLDRLLRLRYS